MGRRSYWCQCKYSSLSEEPQGNCSTSGETKIIQTEGTDSQSPREELGAIENGTKKRQKVETSSTNMDLPIGLCDTLKEVPLLPPEVINEILKNLSTSDLIQCRRVTSTLYDLTSQILTNRMNMELDFSRGGDDSYTCRRMPRCSLCKCRITCHRSLSSLTDCIKLSKNFPLATFSIDWYGERPELLDFFSIHGTKIRSLRLKIFAQKLDKKRMLQLGEILLRWMPNIEILELGLGHVGEWSSRAPLFPKTVGKICTLPRLKTFSVDNCKMYKSQQVDLVPGILGAATNLKKFYTPDDHFRTYLQFNDLLHRLGKVDTVKRVDLVTYDTQSILEMETFARIDWKLHSLRMDIQIPDVNPPENNNNNEIPPPTEFWQRVRLVVEKILIGSKDTLRHLECRRPIRLFLGLITMPYFITLVQNRCVINFGKKHQIRPILNQMDHQDKISQKNGSSLVEAAGIKVEFGPKHLDDLENLQDSQAQILYDSHHYDSILNTETLIACAIKGQTNFGQYFEWNVEDLIKIFCNVRQMLVTSAIEFKYLYAISAKLWSRLEHLESLDMIVDVSAVRRMGGWKERMQAKLLNGVAAAGARAGSQRGQEEIRVQVGECREEEKISCRADDGHEGGRMMMVIMHIKVTCTVRSV